MLVCRLPSKRLLVIIPFTIVIVSFFLRLNAIFPRKSIQHDEAISYLAATCHQSDYAAELDSVEVHPASYWKAYLRPPEKLCLGAITAGILEHDIHPPLYFWLLNAWILVLGVAVWSGTVLNSFLATLTVALVYAMARSLLQRRNEALLVMATYALNPSTLLISQEARQYDLLALLTVIFTGLVLKTLSRQPQGHSIKLVLLPITVFLGAFTHHQFLFPIVGALLIIAYQWWKTPDRFFLCMIGLILAGYLAARLLFPFPAGATTLPALEAVWNELPLRLMRVAGAYSYFFYLLLPLLILGSVDI